MTADELMIIYALILGLLILALTVYQGGPK